MNDPMLDFVKSKLEENEGISPAALSRLLSAAQPQTSNFKHQTSSVGLSPLPSPQNFKFRHSSFVIRHSSLASAMLAASLGVAACGWLFFSSSTDSRREADLTNVIELLYVADGSEPAESASLADTLLAWQDAPAGLEQASSE